MKTTTIREGGVTILIFHKIDFKATKNVIREKEGHFIMIKRSIHEEDKTTIKPYIPNKRSSE